MSTPTERIKAKVEEAKKLRAEATEGPWVLPDWQRPDWEANGSFGGGVVIPGKDGRRNALLSSLRIADAALIVSAANSDPWSALDEAVKALEKVLASAHPNTLEHPTMTAAWAGAQMSLSRIADLLEEGGAK